MIRLTALTLALCAMLAGCGGSNSVPTPGSSQNAALIQLANVTDCQGLAAWSAQPGIVGQTAGERYRAQGCLTGHPTINVHG